MSESFNSWIGEARNKPAVDLIDMVHRILMEQRSKRKLILYTWKGELVPYAEEYIRESTTKKEHFIIRQATSYKAEVEGRLGRHEVNIDNGDCICRVWQLTGLPCIHAAAFIGTTEHPLWHNYVYSSYYVSRYRAAYDGHISTLPGKHQWMYIDGAVEVNVPRSLRPRGRPKKRRIKNFLEKTTSKKSKSIHKYGRCSLWGHHRSTYKNPLIQSSTDQPNAHGIGALHGLRLKLQIKREGMS